MFSCGWDLSVGVGLPPAHWALGVGRKFFLFSPSGTRQAGQGRGRRQAKAKMAKEMIEPTLPGWAAELASGAIEFLENYGWFLLIGGFIVYITYNKTKETIDHRAAYGTALHLAVYVPRIRLNAIHLYVYVIHTHPFSWQLKPH